MPTVVVRNEADYVPRERPGAVEAWVRAHLLQDPRDWPIVRHFLLITVGVVPLGAALFVPGVFRWWMAPLYWAWIFGLFVPPYILGMHCLMHRPVFRLGRRWLNHWPTWLLGPFMGVTPETYAAHHMGMHHPENNLEDDLSSTIRYQRDNLLHWLAYWGRFFFFAIFELSRYLGSRGRWARVRRMLAGELSFYALCAGLWWAAGPGPTVTVFVAPFLAVRILQMCGNWGQHAFVDPDDPGNCYRNSITCINTSYNRRCFNDGYHIIHHLKPAMHWTEMPKEFVANQAKYAEERAIVFDGIDFFQVWVLLMLRQHKALARRMVSLGDRELSEAEKLQLLHERLRPIRRELPAARVAAAA
jgi:fatty acid desaturase